MIKAVILDHPNNDALVLRSEVFVIEQGFSKEDEFDSFELDNTHFYIYEDNLLVGYCRMDVTKDLGHIGRVLVRKEYRKKGLGKMVIDLAIEEAKRLKYNKVYVHAQDIAKGFYLSIGFSVIGNSFYEAGALHWYMEREL